MISPEIQKNAIMRWAKENNRRIDDDDWIIDLDKTGRNFKRKIQKAIGRVESGDRKEIIAYRYDRWGRNAVESLANVGRLEQTGGRLVSVTEPLDAESAIGKYNRTNAFALAEMQSDIISENWQRVGDSRRARGLPHTGMQVYGYVRRGRIPAPPGANRAYMTDVSSPEERYEVIREREPYVREMYRMYIFGSGFTKIAQTLNEAGQKTVLGYQWSAFRVAAYLDSGFAAGKIRSHAKECTCTHPSTCPSSEYIDGAHEPIIEPWEWEKYKKAREDRRRRPPRAVNARNPLIGCARCGDCGGALVYTLTSSKRNVPQYSVMRCSWKYQHGRSECVGGAGRASEIEKEVIESLASELPHLESEASKIKTESGELASRDSNVKDDLKAEISRLTQALKKAAKDRAMNDVPDDVYRETIADLTAARDAKQHELDALEASASSEEETSERVQVARSLVEEWETLPAEGINTLLRELGCHITMRREYPRGPLDVRVSWSWSDHDVWERPAS